MFLARQSAKSYRVIEGRGIGFVDEIQDGSGDLACLAWCLGELLARLAEEEFQSPYERYFSSFRISRRHAPTGQVRSSAPYVAPSSSACCARR